MRVALVTGISSGIGRVTAIDLGRRGFHVIGAGRSVDRSMPVVERIQETGGTAEYLELDLERLASCLGAARAVVDTGRTVDVLVNNAGVGGIRGITPDVFEIHFGVNHLGHFMLTRGLEPVLRDGARVVQVTSAAHFNAEGIDFDRLRRRTTSLLGWNEYGVSKLANMLFVRELAKRRPDLHTYGVHPGMTDTNIIPKIVRPFLRRRLFTPEQGADTVLWCATAEEVGHESGLYYRRRESRPPSTAALEDDLAALLWERSEAWCREAGLDSAVS